jgi:hypothetical protein
MRECPLSRHLGMEAPASPVPPRRWPGLFISDRDDPIAPRLLCGPERAFERCNVGPVHQVRVGYTGPRLFSREEAFMRTIALLSIAFAALSLSTIGARADGTWCAQYGGSNGGTNCGFYSFEQCQAARSGNGGFCSRNPFSAYGSAGSTYGSAREPRRRYRRDY